MEYYAHSYVIWKPVYMLHTVRRCTKQYVSALHNKLKNLIISAKSLNCIGQYSIFTKSPLLV